MEKLTRAEVQKRLQELAKSEAARDRLPGAMCYMTGVPPSTVDYVCSTCGERTLYKPREEKVWWFFTIPDSSSVITVQYEIPECRIVLAEYPQFPLALDESEFCKRCSPNISKPKLALLIRFEGRASPHRLVPIRSTDIQLVCEFLSENATHLAELERLLGVKANEPLP
jgi:hypothetical protein